MRNIPSLRLYGIIALILIAALVSTFFLSHGGKGSAISFLKAKSPLGAPEISGWIPWWSEDSGFDIVAREPGTFTSISPYWYLIQKNNDASSGSWVVEDMGTTTKREAVSRLHKNHIAVIPLVGTEQNGDEFSGLLIDPYSRTNIVNALVWRAVSISADGLDMDIEVVKKEDVKNYSAFLEELSSELKKNGMTLAVSIIAQTGKDTDWDVAKNQDIESIGKIADEVRLLAYDQHSDGYEQGAITGTAWQSQVLSYALRFIPREKIVVGLPNYGYAWDGTGQEPNSFRYDEFMERIGQDKSFQFVRDEESEELHYVSGVKDAWLSDHVAVKHLMENARSLGFNRFIIWSLSGMDERIISDISVL